MSAAADPSVDLSSVIRPGEGLVWGQACAEPQTLVEALIAQRAALSGCRAFIGSSYSGLVRRSVSGLLDPAISAEDQREVEKLIGEYSRRYGVSFHAVRTRQAGARRFVSFHLLVPDAWTVARAHQLSEEIEARMRAMVPNAAIFTHIEPISDPASYDDQELDR